MNELMNDYYGHCGECHDVHPTKNMVEIDGYLYCRKCATANTIATLRADNAKLREALALISDRLPIYKDIARRVLEETSHEQE